MSAVFVAAEERMVVGVYSTKEKAQAACEEWAEPAEWGCNWRRYDGKWERTFKRDDSDWLTLFVTEAEVDK